jgi:predicted amidohydrolase YtcJ
MRQIYTAVTRIDNSGDPHNTWLPEQKLSIGEALQAYTAGPAHGCFREHELGTIEVGKFADIIVLDRNLFKVPTHEILETKVQLTMKDGNIVYEKKEVSISEPSS